MNYTTYDKLRDAKIGLHLNLKQFRLGKVKRYVTEIFNYGLSLAYQQSKQDQVFKRAREMIDVPEDHRVSHLEDILLENDLYTFDVGTEACLSIFAPSSSSSELGLLLSGANTTCW